VDEQGTGEEFGVQPREWHGTLVAEWVESGRSGTMEIEPTWSRWVAMLAAAVAGVFTSAMGLPGGPTFFLYALWILPWGAARNLIGHRSKVALTLTLRPDELSIAGWPDRAGRLAHLARSDSDRLTRRAPTDRFGIARELVLVDSLGHQFVRLKDSMTHVVRVSSGSEQSVESLEADPPEVPLSVLIGSWWPYPERRETERVNRGTFGRGHDIRPWGQPDIGQFEDAKSRYDARHGLDNIVGGSLLVLMFLLGAVVMLDRYTGMAICAVGLSALGVEVSVRGFQIFWPARHDLRAVLGLRKPS
jgi:hypothetical protein